MSTVPTIEVEYCRTCQRARQTDYHGTWQPWAAAKHIGQAVLRRATKVVCDMCTKK